MIPQIQTWLYHFQPSPPAQPQRLPLPKHQWSSQRQHPSSPRQQRLQRPQCKVGSGMKADIEILTPCRLSGSCPRARCLECSTVQCASSRRIVPSTLLRRCRHFLLSTACSRTKLDRNIDIDVDISKSISLCCSKLRIGRKQHIDCLRHRVEVSTWLA
jgi:hypothetical protein